jgi:tetratricopeptide (TPR) repeat protein
LPADRPSIGQRPNVPNRPGGDRPGIDRPGNRPTNPIADRPGFDRPINRPSNPIADRPGVRPGLRPDGGHNTIIGNGNNYFNNWHGGNYAGWVNNGMWGHYDHWHDHFNDWHDHWHGWYHGHWGGYWNNGWGYAAAGAAWVNSWALASTLYNWGYGAYSNPYYVEPAQPVTYLNYSEPIIVPEPAPIPAGATEPPPPPRPPETASQAFDAARTAFKAGDYRTALTKVEQSLKDFPEDPVAHEFRALVLFALGEYRSAAAAIYALLAGGPGWDWTTLSSLYDDPETYKRQLAALQNAAAAAPNDPAPHFLLAYHYITVGLPGKAEEELAIVHKLLPNDALTTRLYSALAGDEAKGEEAPKPAPAEEKLPDIKLDIVGSWSAATPDGGSIGLSMKSDGKFEWTVQRGAKKTSFGGTFTLDENVLMLERSAGGALTGRVEALANDKFRFKAIGGGDADPGLTFVKK